MIIQNNIQITTGSKIVIETLKALGVDTIFGYPGGIVLNLYDELYKQNDIRHILLRHEQSAVHAAEGYSRATGKCGVVLVTSGPGATNTVTGIANAYLDGYPLIVLTGQVDKKFIGKNAFQEVDICNIVKTCTKATFQITDAKDIQNTLIKAYQTANSGKKGPVLVDMAKNIFSQNAEYAQESFINDKCRSSSCSQILFDKVYHTIKNSSRPIIVIGGGVNQAQCYEELNKFICNFNIPVVSTMMGLGAIDSNDEHYLGMIGIFGSNSANQVLRQADLIISLGARFNDRITCMFNDSDLANKIIQIDINPDEISNFIAPKDYLISDVGDFLSYLNECDNNNLRNKFKNWFVEALNLADKNISSKKCTNMMHSFEIIQKLQEYTKNMDIIFTSEVGQHQVSAARDLKFGPNRKIFFSGGSGTMGFGLPSAIGASIAKPEKTVVCICGDGSLQMNIGELSVCRDYGLNLKILVFNNGYLGMVRQLQEKNFSSRYSQTKISNPDFVKLADSFSIKGINVNCAGEIDNAFEKAFADRDTYVIDFKIEPMEVI